MNPSTGTFTDAEGNDVLWYMARPHRCFSSVNRWPTSSLPYFVPSTSMMEPFAWCGKKSCAKPVHAAV